ncbi:MAG: hypothetical protein Q7T54_04570 [Candidatus Levybacteria bacterium]|nr:hypothetical protein [Candidatus Levybacteria bacterium]
MELQEIDLANINLAEQQSNISDSACTAYSLVNLVRMLGYEVSENQLSTLKEEAASQDPSGLTADQRSDFLEKFGLINRNLGNVFSEYSQDKTKLLDEFVKELKQHPVSFVISSALSLKKGSSSLSGTSESGKAETGHQVVAAFINGRVQIIDPYAPRSRYSFNPTNPESMNNLLTTLTSRATQYYLEQDSKPVTRDSVFAEGKRRLESVDYASFIRASMTNNEMYTAVKK